MKKQMLGVVLLMGSLPVVAAEDLWGSLKKSASEAIEKSSEVVSETGEKVVSGSKEMASEATQMVKERVSKNEDRAVREDHRFAANVNWSPIHVPFPMAWGVNGYYIANGNWMLGVDYLNSNKAIKFFSFELGEIKEQSYTLQARRFWGNSFNMLMGIGQRSTEVKLARNLFDLVTNNYSNTVSELETRYVRLGLGNQWHFKRKYTVAVDWISLDIPFQGEVVTSADKYGKTAQDQQDIRDAEDVLKYYPSGAVAQFNIGVVF